MLAHPDDFEPFLEDDEKWEPYVKRISEAGNFTLVAAILLATALSVPTLGLS